MPKIVFQALLLSCLTSLLASAPAWAQPAGVAPAGSFSPLTMDASRRLYAQRHANPTPSLDVRERQARLGQTLAELPSAGQQRLVQKVLDRNEHAVIEDNIQAGRVELAALLLGLPRGPGGPTGPLPGR